LARVGYLCLEQVGFAGEALGAGLTGATGHEFTSIVRYFAIVKSTCLKFFGETRIDGNIGISSWIYSKGSSSYSAIRIRD
jgi:hypothetical protein